MTPMQETKIIDRKMLADSVGNVLDPCGRINGTQLSLAALGMVDDVSVGVDGRVDVRLLLDDPVCIYTPEIVEAVRNAALKVPGVTGDEQFTNAVAAEDKFGRNATVGAADDRSPRRLVRRHCIALLGEVDRAELGVADVVRVACFQCLERFIWG